MSNDELTLHPGAPGSDETGDGYIPRIALQHEGENGHELYVVVGEEVGGMIEHVPFSAMEGIAARVLTDEELKHVRAYFMGDRFDVQVINAVMAKADKVLDALTEQDG